ncbi:MAG: OsmC family protein [Pseudomonadota bacterium]
MEAFPHHYSVSGHATSDSHVALEAPDLPELVSAPPAEFDGPGDKWSPETLLVGAVADCFILTFRAVAQASKLEWVHLECRVTGTLDRIERTMRFTEISVEATLQVPAGSDVEKAEKLLHKAEQGCLITNSLIAESTLQVTVQVAS